MESKVFEVRDRMTFIPLIAVRMNHREADERYLVRQAGWREEFLFGRMSNDSIALEHVARWRHCATLGTACEFIAQNWEALENGAVIDSEYIRGESKQPKVKQRLENPLSELYTTFAP